jgi:L-serine dehydratase
MNIFDIIGPVMIGPSSSHTAGAVRLGRIALALLGDRVKEGHLGLHGSFAKTFQGHGTDRALVAGLLGWVTDDPRIPGSLDHAREACLEVQFHPVDLGEQAHPNSVLFELMGHQGSHLLMAGCSIGGGRIRVTALNGFPVKLTGEVITLVTMHQDQPGVIHLVSGILAERDINVAQMRVSRKARGASAVMILEIDQSIDDETLRAIASLPQINAVRGIEIL